MVLCFVTVGMVLGRSGLTSQEFTVHPRTIDKDFKGEIKVIAHVKREMQAKCSHWGLTQVTGSLSCNCFPISKAKLFQ